MKCVIVGFLKISQNSFDHKSMGHRGLFDKLVNLVDEECNIILLLRIIKCVPMIKREWSPYATKEPVDLELA